jgi:hypothetical protein
MSASKKLCPSAKGKPSGFEVSRIREKRSRSPDVFESDSDERKYE